MVFVSVVCCAKTESKVEFVDPPAGAPVGERVTFEGLDGYDPVSPAQVEKKKVVVKAMPVGASVVCGWFHFLLTMSHSVPAGLQDGCRPGRRLAGAPLHDQRRARGLAYPGRGQYLVAAAARL